MTARLSVVRSVPVLTAVVTVVSDSPASSIFHSVVQSTSAIPELIPPTFNLGCLLRSSTVVLWWDRSSRPGSGLAAVDRGAVSTSGQALQLKISSTEFFCSVTC